MYKFTTSMMCADPFRLESILPVIDGHTDLYHIDIMDGHFVPNFALSIDYIKLLKKHVTKPIDAHLMVTDPDDYIDQLIAAGVAYITLHPRTIEGYAFRIIKKIKDAGINVGIALSPSVGFDVINYYIHLIDKITIMTVEPGFAGQPMIEEVLRKISEAKTRKIENNYKYLIEIDGSNNFKTFKLYIDHGAEIFVLGTGLFNYEDLDQGFREIKDYVQNVTKN